MTDQERIEGLGEAIRQLGTVIRQVREVLDSHGVKDTEGSLAVQVELAISRATRRALTRGPRIGDLVPVPVDIGALVDCEIKRGPGWPRPLNPKECTDD